MLDGIIIWNWWRRPARKSVRAVVLAGILLAGLSEAGAQEPALECLSMPPSLPQMSVEGRLAVAGAQIWYGSVGHGQPIILLHGGMASSRSWGAQVPALVRAGYRAVLIDSRGHGRSTMGKGTLSYQRMAKDVLAVMDHLRLRRPIVVGWSDGAVVSLALAIHSGTRLGGVYAFGANIDASGVRADAGNAPVLAYVGPRLATDYAALSPTPANFHQLQVAVRAMQGKAPYFSVAQLQAIATPAVMIAGAEEDEFILPAHQADLASMIAGAKLEMFAEVGHFAPWQKPDTFNRSLLDFISRSRLRAKP